MGKGLALFGLILIIVGLLPILLPMVGITMLTQYFFILGLYEINLGGFIFSELMLILIGLGVVLLIVGAMR
jgi:hypothetical protein